MFDVLKNIFGAELSGFTEKEIVIARRVVEHFMDPRDSGNMDSHSKDVLEACKHALKEEGFSWEDVMLKHSRKRNIVELRDCIAYIFFERVGDSQERKTRMLGGAYNRTSLLHAVNNARIWKEIDPRFKSLFGRISRSVEDYLTLNNKDYGRHNQQRE